MTNPRESGAWTEVRPQNTITVAMEDLPEAEGRVLEKELKEEMAEARRKKLAYFDQENHPSCHDYGNCYIYGNS
jgi:hypothetical protein